eukprot:2248070-Rhodomonas_salina.1
MYISTNTSPYAASIRWPRYHTLAAVPHVPYRHTLHQHHRAILHTLPQYRTSRRGIGTRYPRPSVGGQGTGGERSEILPVASGSSIAYLSTANRAIEGCHVTALGLTVEMKRLPPST